MNQEIEIKHLEASGLPFEETSGYVRPEWVNKWPNSMTDIGPPL